VLLFQMAGAAKPFEGPAIAELLSSILRDPPAALTSAVPQPLKDVISRCLEKDARRRFQHAAEVRVALETVASTWRSGWSGERSSSYKRIRHRLLSRSSLGILSLLAVVAFSAAWYFWPVPRSIPRIAVLPLVNRSQDIDQQFLVDGLTEGIINTLGRVTSVEVTARTSVMPYKGSTKTVAVIASELGVDAVVEGSATLIRATGVAERVRVDFSLIDPRSQTQIWSDTVERDLGGVLTLQGEIARIIAEKLHAGLTPVERKILATQQLIDPEAAKLYLLGRQAWTTRTAPALQAAVGYFNQAIEREPTYALAFAGLADSYVLLTGDFGAMTRADGAAKTVAAATRAIELDSTLAEAHTSLAFASYFLKWDFGLAGSQFARAIQLNPSYATAHHWYGDYLSTLGREDEALAEMRQALALDPLSPIISRDVAWPLFFGRRYADAIQQLTVTLKRHAGYLPAERLMARAYAQIPDSDEAIRRFERLAPGDGFRGRCELAWAYATAGRRADAERELQAVLGRTTGTVYPYDLALVYTALGRRDEAFAELTRAFEERDPTLVNLRHDPRLDALRPDPRYATLVGLMRFPK
ncbi:MAG: hypothetical protein ABIP90_06090, partial [Vicinamibacterales bacterium]